MNKRVFVVAVIILVAISSLMNFSLSLSEDPKWTPYVLNWKQKLPTSNSKKKTKEITTCKTVKEKSGGSTQR